MISLKDKVVVITGASSGIGKATAVKFAQKGARLVLAARRTEKLSQLKDFITTFNKNCIYVKTDVTDPDQVKILFDRAEAEFGNVEILINNAGRGLRATLNHTSIEEWNSVINTNLNSVFLCTKQAIERMMAQKTHGHIITVSSMAAYFAPRMFSAYCASKHAVTAFTKSIKGELRRHQIKTSTIHPGRINTEFFDIYKRRPNKSRMLLPEDIADYLTAIAERSIKRIIAIKALNLLKRVYYPIKSIF